jgi:uncharacterized protein (TIGR03083 family)
VTFEQADALADIYAEVTAVVGDLGDADFDRHTGCDAWSVQDLLFHLLLDAQRALVVLADPGIGEPDTDARTYWQNRPWESGEAAPDESAHIRFVRRSALAYATPDGLVAQWRSTSEAAVAAARRTDADATVRTQGCSMRAADFVGTLVVEATLHYFDLTLHLPDARRVPRMPLSVTRTTLEKLLGLPPPTSWSAETLCLKLSGRQPLDAAERKQLGAAAGRLPLVR